jgi:hypothetical protein
MGRATKVGAAGALAVLAACSGETAGTRNPNGGDTGGNGGNGGNGGLILGSGGLGNGGVLGNSDGGPGGAAGNTVVDPTPDPCMATADCKGAAGAAYVCTTANQCGLINGNCATQAECMGDTYCCKGPACRKDGMDQGVCIPAYVGPGAECKGAAHVGVFAPGKQCEWPLKDAAGKEIPPAVSPQHVQVLSTPMVADTPVDSGASAEIVFVAGNQSSGEVSGAEPTLYGVLRIVSGQTCELKATIDDPQNRLRQSAPPALGDLDGDGKIDIVARRNDQGLVAFHWTGTKYETYWHVDTEPDAIKRGDQVWDGPVLHDLDNDGIPEVLLRTAVFNGRTGALITAGPSFSIPFNGLIPIVGDLDGDNKLELITAQQYTSVGISHWENNAWTTPTNGDPKVFFGTLASHFAYADFGSYKAGKFNHTAADLDGKAEIVAVNVEGGGPPGKVSVYSMDETGVWQTVMSVDTQWDPTVPAEYKIEGGGPPTVGDFDGDKVPEFAIAGGTRFRVFDFDCETPLQNGCSKDQWVRWSQLSQDASSKQTGGSAFDFDGDGKTEVVYADECFLRVYEGLTGNVIFSAYRTSPTWYEGPVIADVDKDQNTEIVVNSAEPAIACPAGSDGKTGYTDPIHNGVPCFTNDDCTSKKCDGGLCRCAGPSECDSAGGLVCEAPPAAGDPAKGNTCRAQHPGNVGLHGIRVLKDGLDRWASSRPLWNQHPYTITNINDDGTIPKTADWLARQNFKTPGLNNFRTNVQGATSADDLPDITGKFMVDQDNPCQVSGGGDALLTARVCNRGKRSVGADMPATFYDDAGKVLCTAHTDGPVPTTTGCKPVSCTIKPSEVPRVLNKKVTIKVNDDGKGGRSTVECLYDNNSDTITVTLCKQAS